jgi:hypothetical protein
MEARDRKRRLLAVSLSALALGFVASGYLITSRSEDPSGPQPGTEGPAAGQSDAIEAERLEALRALPYVHSRPLRPTETREEGVILHDRSRAQPGLNLYWIEIEPVARLIDMDGNLVHEWANDREDWHHLELGKNGNLFIVGEEALVKMNWESEMLWLTSGIFHHDLARRADGILFALMPGRSDRRARSGRAGAAQHFALGPVRALRRPPAAGTDPPARDRAGNPVGGSSGPGRV